MGKNLRPWVSVPCSQCRHDSMTVSCAVDKILSMSKALGCCGRKTKKKEEKG